jgi:NADH:ubiquinone oxidoreductase subunit F (NADH-binding)
MRAVADGPRPRAVVVNGTEGEPASAKDRLLMTVHPHLVLDGALLAAAAVGASKVFIGVDESNQPALQALGSAIAERRRREPAAVALDVRPTPSRYVAGEERALVHWVNGGPAVPTSGPGRPSERGALGRPTLVQNVETLSHLAQIATFGPAWFASVGTPAEPGTRLFTVSGAVRRPAVIELPIGARLDSALGAAGGPSRPVQALLVGGFYGTWLPPLALDAPLSRQGLDPYGGAPGAGVVVVLPDGACGLAETARLLAWFAAESAGQCGPCVFGLADVAAQFGLLASGRASPADMATLMRWSAQIEGRGACRHPDGGLRLMRSALKVFSDDVQRHLAGRPCPCPQSVLDVPGSGPRRR